MTERLRAATNRPIAVRLAVARALGRTRHLDDVYSAALNTLAECLDVSRASVLLFDSDGVMRFKAYRGLSSEYRAAVQGHSPWTPDTVDAEPLLVPDVTRDPSLERFLPVFAQAGIAALAFIPLVSLGRVIGKFMLYYDAPHAFDDEEVQLATVIAGAVAFAVDRGTTEAISRSGEGSLGFEPDPAIGAWHWVASGGTDRDERRSRIPSESLRQVRQCNVADSRDCVKILDLDARIVYINRAGLEHLGVDDETTLLNRPWVELWPEKEREALRDVIAQAKTGAIGRFQGPRRTPAGIMKWWDVVMMPIVDADGAIVQFLAASRDVSTAWRAEAFQAGQHQVLEMIATGAPLHQVLTLLAHVVEDQCEGTACSILLLDEDGVHVRTGAAPSLPEEYSGRIDGQPLGPRVGACGTAMQLGRSILVTDIARDARWEALGDVVVASGLRACWSAPILSSSSRKRVLGSFAMYSAVPRGPSREELRLIETAADLAGAAIDHHRSHEALRQSEERNRAILRAIPDWMFVLSSDGVYLDCHVNSLDRLLVPPEAFLGKSIHDVLPAWLADRFARAFERALASNEPERLEYSLDQDEPRFYEACVVRCDSDRLLSIVRDITDRKRAELDAAAQREELAHLNRVLILNEQTGALAHELSQPLAAILSNAQAARRMLDQSPLDLDELRATLDDVIKSDKRAGAVIHRLRELLRKNSVDLEPVDLNEVTREVIDLTHSDLLLRRMPLKTALSPGIPPVLGDRVQLQQVILNLVLNACEAMSTVEPADRELMLSTAADDKCAQITIADRGIGIPPGQLDAVFDPFVTHRTQGLGLGLAISRSIVLAHRGRIHAENNPDRGATFRCFLPLADA